MLVHRCLLVPERDACSERGCADGAVSMLTEHTMDPEVRFYLGHEPHWASDMQLACTFMDESIVSQMSLCASDGGSTEA